MSGYPVSARNRVRRAHLRGAYDQESVHRILDASPICHVGYVIDGQPYVTPTIQWRDGNRLYWHGSSASRMLRTVKQGVPVCVTVTLFDGLVLARAPFHHSANYRSVMLYGCAAPVEAAADKEAALDMLMERLTPGRLREVRGNTDQELKATTVVSMAIEEASAKVRSGPPADDAEDYDAVPCWAGVLPIRQVWGEPVADPRMTEERAAPDYLTRLVGQAL